MKILYESKIGRRAALKWISAAAATLAAKKGQERKRSYIKTPKGYGTDPDLNNPSSPWGRIMTEEELQNTAALTDLILPEDPPHPAPSALGVPDFINEWVSSPYEQTQKDKDIIMRGLAWINDEAKKRFGEKFYLAETKQQLTILDEIAADPKQTGRDLEHDFFFRFRRLTLGGYYTTPEGFEDIGYIGNVPLTSYPGPSVAQKIELEKRMKKQGI